MVKLGGLADEAGGVTLPPGQCTGLGLQGVVDALGGTQELDVAVALDRHRSLGGALIIGDLLIDAAQRAPRLVMAELVVDHPVRDSAIPLAFSAEVNDPGCVNTSPSGICSSGAV